MRVIAFGAALCCATTVYADPAVESIHYQISLNTSWNNSTSSGDWRSTFANGTVTLPMGDYLGASLFGSIGTSEADDAVVGSCDIDTHSLGGGLFVRDANVGRIGASISRSHSEACFTSAGISGTADTTTDAYGVDAEYYFRTVTVGLSRSWVDYDDGWDADLARARAAWYPMNNLSLAFAIGALDAEDSRSATLEYQPGFFGDAVGIRLGYSYYKEEPSDGTWTVGLAYYFDKRVDLLSRDRRYR